MAKHECFLKVAQRGDIDLLFVGDSITDFFGRADRGRDIWLDRYGALKAANFGISGDTTQDVLWRMQNGELAGFEARVIVLMIGTNNLRRNDNAGIVAGNAAIVREFRKQQPDARILLLGVFQRDSPTSPTRDMIREINSGLAGLADGDQVVFLDIGDRFLNPDGTFRDGLMADGVHPATPGYALWAEAIDPVLNTLLAR